LNETLDLLVSGKAILVSLKAQDVVDVSYLNAVLDEIEWK